MAAQTINLPTQTLTTSAQTSSGLGGLDSTIALGLITLSTITSTMGVQVQVEQTSSGSNWAVLLSGGNTVYITSGNAIVINPFPYKQLRFGSSVTEATAIPVLCSAQFVI